MVHRSVMAFAEKPALRWVSADDPSHVKERSYTSIWALSGCLAQKLKNHIGKLQEKAPHLLSPLLKESAPIVAVAVDDGPWLPLSELAALRSGAAIVPLDPHDPTARLAGLLSESQPRIVVTKDRGDAKKLRDAVALAGGPSVPVIDASEEWPDFCTNDTEPCMSESLGIDPERLCYMWFTSGSTGKPKGCLVTHGAFAHYCGIAKNESHGVTPQSTVLVATANTFDPSVGDIFASWAVGATVACAPKMWLFAQLAWVIEHTLATHVCCTPSLWRTLEVPPCCKMLRNLVCLSLGGEKMTRNQTQTWSERADLKLVNVYGTTECTVWQTCQVMTPETPPTIAGVPMPGNTIAVVGQVDGPLSDQTCTKPNGEAGEVLIGGVQVGRGYFQRPELTSLRFTCLPKVGPGLWYRTGDMGRLVDGTLEMLGRADNQVKIRGIRVELGEIEEGIVAAAGSHVACAAAVVLVQDRLLAYCEASRALESDLSKLLPLEGEEAVALWEHPVVTEFLLRNVAQRLPRHMLPSRFLLVRKLPLNSSGKVSAAKLPSPSLAKRAGAAEDGALTKLEEAVAKVWAEILGIEMSGIRAQDHFMELGGASPEVLRVSRKLRTVLSDAGVREEQLQPDGPLAHTLAPERLIHIPRLAQYAKLLERAGLARWLLGAAGPDIPTLNVGGSAAEISTTLTSTTGTKAETSVDDGDGDGDHLDHDSWEQVPKTSPEDMLFKAASAGLSSLVHALLAEGVRVDGGRDAQAAELATKAQRIGAPPYMRHFLTPLHVAATNSHAEVVQVLINARADPSVRDRRGSTPLHCAAQRGTASCASVLLHSGAPTLATDQTTRSSAMHLAAKSGNAQVIGCLLEWASQHEGTEEALEILDRWQRTPLHWGILQGHMQVCQVLVAARANVERPDMDLDRLPKRTRRALDRAYESPMEIAIRVYGGDGGSFGALLRAAGAAPVEVTHPGEVHAVCS